VCEENLSQEQFMKITDVNSNDYYKEVVIIDLGFELKE